MIKREINYITRNDERYPKRFEGLDNMPEGLYCIGELPDDDIPSVGIIGARNCSGYGRQMAREFAREIAGAGIQVISGMAGGVDGISQSAAVAAGGRSFGILGGGVDICYPPANSDLYEKLMDNGGLISEYPPGTPPIGRNFALRNRIISAFSDALLVIEARERSGTLITVGYALQQGKDVYALPGRVTDSLSYGCNSLIADGAYPLLRPYEFVREFLDRFVKARNGCREVQNIAAAAGKDPADEGKKGKQKEEDNRLRFMSAKERLIVSVLDYRPKTVSEILYDISDRSDMGIPELMGLLTNMTIKHIIDCVDGCNYLLPT